MATNPPLFQPQYHLQKIFDYSFKTGRVERSLGVCLWDDRLVAHEEASGLWWGTLDACGERDAREFWSECVSNGRVGRLFSRRRDFQMSREHGATLSAKARLFHVLVTQDNSGFARADGNVVWHPFPAVKPWGIRKPLANRPTILSRRFTTKFARRAMDSIYEQDAVESMPEMVREFWWKGAGALPLRLVGTAGELGWADKVSSQTTLQQFWQEVLRGRSRTSGMAVDKSGRIAFAHREKFAMENRLIVALLIKSRALCSLLCTEVILHDSSTTSGISPQQHVPISIPAPLLQSPEVAASGNIVLSSTSRRFNEAAAFVWHGPDVKLRVELRSGDESAHERLESRLELRDWLSRFYAADEVESWFWD